MNILIYHIVAVAIFLLSCHSIIHPSNQSTSPPAPKRNKHVLAIVTPDDPSSIEIVPEGITWLKTLKEPISFVFQFKAGEENVLNQRSHGLISESSNISESDSAGFKVEKIYVNFNADSDPMRTWKLYSIPALISSSFMIERGDHFKGAPKAMQIYNILRQSLLPAELNRTKAFDLGTLKYPSIFWYDNENNDNELKYITSARVDNLINSKPAVDLPEYFDTKAEDLDLLAVKSRIFTLARPKQLRGESMTGDEMAEFIKYLVRYLNSDRYPNQLELAFMQIYKKNYCQLGAEDFADKLNQLNEQLELPAITEFKQHSERVRKQIEKLMCPKFDPKKWCKSDSLTV